MQSDYGQPLNLGQDRLVTDIAGTPITKNHIFGPQGVRGRNSDNSRLREVVGWQPEISLEQGLGNTYAWLEAQVQKTWRAKPKLSSSRNSQREPVSVLCPISSEPPVPLGTSSGVNVRSSMNAALLAQRKERL